MRKLAVSVQEAADMIGVSKSHMHNMVNQGTIRSVPLGSRKLIPIEELERFIAKGSLGETRAKEAVTGNDK